MLVRDCMQRDVRTCTPQTSVQDVARLMAEIDAGSIPVGEQDRLVGMITDRDITVRVTAKGLGPETAAREAMSPGIDYCFEDDDLEDASILMGRAKVHRLPVLNREKRLVGILSVGDLSKSDDPLLAQSALAEGAEPGGPHQQA